MMSDKQEILRDIERNQSSEIKGVIDAMNTEIAEKRKNKEIADLKAKVASANQALTEALNEGQVNLHRANTAEAQVGELRVELAEQRVAHVELLSRVLTAFAGTPSDRDKLTEELVRGVLDRKV